MPQRSGCHPLGGLFSFFSYIGFLLFFLISFHHPVVFVSQGMAALSPCRSPADAQPLYYSPFSPHLLFTLRFFCRVFQLTNSGIFSCVYCSALCIHFPLFLFTFQQANDVIAALTQRIKSLEYASSQTIPDVKGLLHKITNYGFRRPEDFDKYEALALAEQLATASRLSADQKASTYDAIASTLREKLSCSTKQFKAYYVALLADKEYSKVLDTVAKVDKTFKGQTTPANQRSGPSRFPPRCYECGVTGHIASRCYRRSNRPYSRSKPLMAPPPYKK